MQDIGKLRFGAVYHIEVSGRRYYVRILYRNKSNIYFGPQGFANGPLRYEAVPRGLPWQLTPEHEIPQNFLA